MKTISKQPKIQVVAQKLNYRTDNKTLPHGRRDYLQQSINVRSTRTTSGTRVFLMATKFHDN